MENYYLNKIFRNENTVYSIDYQETFIGTKGKKIKECYFVKKADVADELIWESVSQHETKSQAIKKLKEILKG